jgi:nitrite reductase/ring-hydroxylating ferredoxin subunit
VATISKLTILSFTLAITIIFSSCNKDNDVIPDVRVNFYLNLNDPEFVTLSTITNHVIVTSQTNNIGSLAAGFNNNGIIVYTYGIDEFYAYDRTCPHDYVLDGTSVKVAVSDLILAVCPKCSTKYALYGGGVPTSGPGKYPLKNYRTSFERPSIRVWN